MVRCLSILVLLAGCGNRPPEEVCAPNRPDTDTTPPTPTDTGTPPPTDTGTPPIDPAVLDPGQLVECPDPTLRETAHYTVRRSDYPGDLNGAYVWGGGAVVEDFDDDGDLDLFVTGDDRAQLWRSDGGSAFEDVSATALAGIPFSKAVGGSAVDYDGDGDLDILVTQWEAPTLLLENDGSGVFTDVAARAGLAGHSYKSQSSSWADIDADGDLDLFVGSYGEFTIIDRARASPSRTAADHLADPSELYRNNGDGTFTDITDHAARAPPQRPGEDTAAYARELRTLGSAWIDIDGDGLPELFTAPATTGSVQPSVLLDNQGGATTRSWSTPSSGYHARPRPGAWPWAT